MNRRQRLRYRRQRLDQERRKRQRQWWPADREWFYQLKEDSASSYQGYFSGSRSLARLPSQRKIGVFIEYLNPVFKQGVSPSQVRGVVEHSLRSVAAPFHPYS